MANSISQGAIARIMTGTTGVSGFHPVVQVCQSLATKKAPVLKSLVFKIELRTLEGGVGLHR